jgi:hypothetical protein
MPFLDDSGVKLEHHTGPLWRAFALFGDQIERLVTVNLAWSVHLIPAMAALALPGLPTLARGLLTAYTLLVLPPVTAWMISLVVDAAHQQPLDLGLAKDRWRQHARSGLRTLGPLWGLLGLLWWSAAQLTVRGADAPATLIYLALLISVTSANYWGLLTVYHPDWPAPRVFTQSLRLWWQHPVPTLLLSGMVLLAGVIGMLSVGGLFLAVPVIITMLQAQMFEAITAQPQERATHD